MNYPSQLRYGPCGHLICTPVSCAVAVAFLGGGMSALSPSHVAGLMRQSHALVASMSGTPHMLMLSELHDLIPVPFEEVAGLTHSMPYTPTSDDDDNPLVLCSLKALLLHCRGLTHPTAVVATHNAHTTAYLMDGTSSVVYHFDPLPATLRPIDPSDFHARAVEYSGLVLYK